MTTLYDLLGARPGDDTASLKTAFRNAVKASHPDLHTDDPEAPSRFDQIVCANAILRDAEQRKAYDQLLAFELWQHHVRSQHHVPSQLGVISRTMLHLASDAIAVAVLALALTGGYVLLTHAAKPSVPASQIAEEIAHGRPEPAPDNAQEQVILVSRQELHELLEGPGAAGEASTPRPIAAGANDAAAKDGGAAKDDVAKDDATMDVADAGAAPGRPSSDASLGDAKLSDTNSSDPLFFRKRGMAAYRNGDLDRALADFDQAIRLDPDSATAYIDRGIVFYRKAESERAFADIAQATRIEIFRRPPASPSKPQKTSAARKP